MNNSLLEKDFISKFSKAWKEGEDLKEANLNFYSSPFKFAVLENFCESSEIVTNLLKDIQEVNWSKKQNDLYSFRRTEDLGKIDAKFLKKFYNFLLNEVKPWIEKVCDVKVNKVSASCSMYNNGDYLLVHDDLLSDRQIAYVFYLSPFDKSTWTEEMGGALEIFNVDSEGYPVFPTIRKIAPKNNQFVFFKVGSLSFHQVGEVTNLNYPRMSINGWFHGEVNTDLKSVLKPKIDYLPIEPSLSEINLSLWISKVYLHPKTKEKIQNCIEMKSEISLEDFLNAEVFKELSNELKNKDLEWNVRGPASNSHYESLNVKNVQKRIITEFFDLITSKEIFKLLFEYTALDLYGKNAKKPVCFYELQRFNKGCYTILFDESFAEDCKLNLFLYFNSKGQPGTVTYLSHDDDGTYEDMNSDSALLTISPQDNSLNLVYCTENQTHFTHYISKLNCNSSEYVYRLYCTYKE